MKVAMGQPAEHLPHWKQRRTDVPDNDSTLRTKSTSIVSCEMIIFFFFTMVFLSGYCTANIQRKSKSRAIVGKSLYLGGLTQNIENAVTSSLQQLGNISTLN
jgi:uncharacterized protein with PQ loop repeat